MSDSESEVSLPLDHGHVTEDEEEVELPGDIDDSDSDGSVAVLPGACCSKNCCSLPAATFFGYNASAIPEETDVAGGQAHIEKVYNMVVQAIKKEAVAVFVWRHSTVPCRFCKGLWRKTWHY